MSLSKGISFLAYAGGWHFERTRISSCVQFGPCAEFARLQLSSLGTIRMSIPAMSDVKAGRYTVVCIVGFLLLLGPLYVSGPPKGPARSRMREQQYVCRSLQVLHRPARE